VAARSASAAEVSASAFPFVFVLGFAADKGFINFNVSNELLELDIKAPTTTQAQRCSPFRHE